MAQWVATRDRWIKDSHYFPEQETLPNCLVLVGSRNIFERDLHE